MSDPNMPTEAGIRIGYVQSVSTCWTFFRYHLMSKASERGMTVLVRVVGPLSEAIAEIENLLRESIDVLIFRPLAVDDAGLIATLKHAQALGVQLIALDGAVGGDLDITTISVDNAKGQGEITDYICQRLGGHGKIAHFQGNQGIEAGLLRTQGLHRALERYPGIELAYEPELDWTSTTPLRTQGAQLTRSALLAEPLLGAIITTSDEAAFGVNEVLEEQGLQDKVLLAGFDALPEALIAIQDGRMEASVYQPLELMAERALDDVVRLVREQPGVVTHTLLPAETICRANLPSATLRALRLFPSVINELDLRSSQQQASAKFLETLIDNLPDILFVKDAETLAFVRRNRAADEWLGVEPGSYIGKNAFDIYPEDVATRFHESDRAMLALGKPVDIPEEISYLPGKGMRYMHTQKVAILDTRGKPAYLLGILQDITEQKMAEMALAQHARDLEVAIETLKTNREKLVAAEKMAALGTLVAGVAHELNTPIGNALVVATTLMDSTRSLSEKYSGGMSRSALEAYLADAGDGAGLLERNLHRAADLINSFKQIAIDQSSSQARQFSLATVVSEVLLTLWPTTKKTPFKVTMSVPADIVMNSYPGPLEQVLINLVNNALTHGLEGRDRGVITLSASLASPGSVLLVVEDDGKGIPDELHHKIFSPFFTTKTDQGGSGLGLSIAHNIVTGLLGGEIELISTVGEGARFCMTLPLIAPHLTEARSS